MAFCSKCQKAGIEETGDNFHSRTSSTRCKFYKPRLKNQLRQQHPDEVLSTRTIKTGFNSLCNVPEVAQAVNEAVHTMTAISYRAGRLVQAFVLHHLANNIELPNMSYEFFMRLPFQIIGNGRSVKNQILDGLYRDIFGVETFDTNNLCQIISNAAKQYASNCKTYVATTLKLRIKKWYVHQLQRRCSYLSHKQCNYLFHKRTVKNFKQMKHAQLCMVEMRMKNLDRKLSSIMGGLPYELESTEEDDENETSMFEEWWKYMKPLSKLLSYFNKHGLAGFNMVPMTSLTPNYIFIDTDAFYFLLRRVQKSRQRQGLEELSLLEDLPKDVKIFRTQTECTKWWKQCFKVEKLETRNKLFGMALSTDGHGCSVNMLKKRPRESQDMNTEELTNKYGFTRDKKYIKLKTDEETRMVGLDPGRLKPFTAVDQDNKVVRCTKEEYYRECGFTRSQRKRDKWMKNSPEIQTVLNSIPSGKTTNIKEYENHCRFILQNDKKLLSFYGHKRWKKERFQCGISKQRYEMKMIERITQGKKNCVVALGNGGFSHNSKGNPSTPTKRLYKLLKREKVTVRLIDEFRTSATCSSCEKELPKSTRYWQVKVCNDSSCLISWNRDVNAARNILKIFRYMQAKDGERPKCMRRLSRTDERL